MLAKKNSPTQPQYKKNCMIIYLRVGWWAKQFNPNEQCSWWIGSKINSS